MKYTDERIQNIIEQFIVETQQHELRYVIAFCLGYFGYISNQIWRVIEGFIREGFIK